ncbi:MAG: glycerol-3-phosphate dehydrogenase [Paracoccus denitrificans]|nr:MAG: glycerol-3-phosphate dehydrogenase [Paracoccus denitrificans]PZO85284.1 MAG: glycerol-3-phosphate dehydrogenase [Paracoccus denitrificans]
MIGVVGAGAFGTALAVALSANGPVTLWGRDVDFGRQNPRLPGVTLPDAVQVTRDLSEMDADTVLLAIPAQALRPFLADHGAALDGRKLVSCAKGIDRETGQSPTDMIAAACPNATLAVLTGPSFAADIARGQPTALTLACADAAMGQALQFHLSTPTLRLYRTTDVIGAELGGALKNIVAIAAGAAIGAGFGDSARAAVITRGFAEMTRFAVGMGAQAETLTGLSGLGDLILTTTSDGSRNYRFGFALGAGTGFDPAVTVEGAATAQIVAELAARMGVAMPITRVVVALSTGQLEINQALDALLSRPLKEE